MNKSKRQLHYLLETIVKCEDTPKELGAIYKTMLEGLRDAELCTITNFTCKQIKTLLVTHCSLELADYEAVLSEYKKELATNANEVLEEQKKEIFISLMGSNFGSKKSYLDISIKEFENNLTPVEVKMYSIIKTYIGALLEALDVFVLFDERYEASVEQLSHFALSIHAPLMDQIFFEEEREHVEEGLKQIAVVYIGLYYQNLYM